jgi:hypothetical protein
VVVAVQVFVQLLQDNEYFMLAVAAPVLMPQVERLALVQRVAAAQSTLTEDKMVQPIQAAVVVVVGQWVDQA